MESPSPLGTPEESARISAGPAAPVRLQENGRWGLSRTNLYAVAVCFGFLYVFSYFATEIVPAPLLWYFPLEQRWVYGSSVGPGLMMGWYGKVLLSFALAAFGAGLLAAGLRLSRRDIAPGPQLLLDLAAMSTVAFAMYYIARSLTYRVL